MLNLFKSAPDSSNELTSLENADKKKKKKNNKKKKQQPVFGVVLRDLEDIPEFVREGIAYLEERGTKIFFIISRWIFLGRRN